MADRDLIDGYLDDLAQRLPPEVVEELADGLEQTVRHHVTRGLSLEAAVAAAIADFGRPTQVVAEFARHSAGRRTAVALLATSPVFAGLWGASLVGARAWTWPFPLGVAILCGITLVLVAAAFLVVARSNDLSTMRLACPASAVLILLDLGVLAAVLTVAPIRTPVMVLAAAASLIRVGLSLRNLPRLVARA